MRVAVLGAAGGIGQPLCLLLKQQLPPGSTLLMYDLMGVEGVAIDLSHIDTDVSIEWGQGTLPPIPYCPALSKLVKDVDLVIISAGVPRKPGMTRDDLLATNAEIVYDLVTTCARASSPRVPAFAIITNPVNSVVPIAAQALRALGCYNRDLLFGITTLDVIRSTQFVNTLRPLHARTTSVPVVGGHSGSTIVPLFSQIPGGVADLENTGELKTLLQRVQNAGTEVVNAKQGKGSATLSMAAAGARFIMQLVQSLSGEVTSLTYAYVDITFEQDSIYRELTTPGITFLAVPITLGKTGITQRHEIGDMLPLELEVWKNAINDLDDNIKSAMKWVSSRV